MYLIPAAITVVIFLCLSSILFGVSKDYAGEEPKTPMLQRLKDKLLLRRCRGCKDKHPHSHHLTRMGLWYYSRGTS